MSFITLEQPTMSIYRTVLPLLAALGLATLVTGCVAYPAPAYPNYGYPYGYGYYGPSVVFGWHGDGWHR